MYIVYKRRGFNFPCKKIIDSVHMVVCNMDPVNFMVKFGQYVTFNSS